MGSFKLKNYLSFSFSSYILNSIFIISCIFFQSVYCDDKPVYSILTPKTFNPKDPFPVYLSVQDTDGPVEFNVYIRHLIIYNKINNVPVPIPMPKAADISLQMTTTPPVKPRENVTRILSHQKISVESGKVQKVILRFGPNERVTSNDEDTEEDEEFMVEEPPPWVPDDLGQFSSFYQLHIEGGGGGIMPFINSTVIYPESKTYSIYIQLDKGIYKPGETVKFRVLQLNKNSRPLSNPLPLDITIKDNLGNIVKYWKNVNVSDKGVFSSQMSTSSDGNLGTWTVEVRPIDIKKDNITSTIDASSSKSSFAGKRRPNNNQHKLKAHTQTFSIAQYVLPKYNVEIKGPKFLTFNQTKPVILTIKASYTYGKGLKGGKCEIIAYESNKYYYWTPQKKEDEKVKRSITLDENGVGHAEFSISEELKIYGDEYATEKQVTFDIHVIEDLTGKEMNSSLNIPIYKYSYKIDQVGSVYDFKPGLPYNLTVKISSQDDVPIIDEEPNAVLVHHGFSYSHQDSFMNYSLGPDAHGLITMTFTTPTNDLINVNSIEVTYKEVKKWIYPGGRARSLTNSFIQIALVKNSNESQEKLLKVDEPIPIEVLSTRPMKNLYYAITSRGSILSFQKVDLKKAVKKFILKVKAPIGKAAPKSKLIVFSYVKDERNELIADSLDLLIEGGLDNHLNITIEKVENGNAVELEANGTVAPGDFLKLNLKSKEKSMVALRGIDQSVLLLKNEDPDITKEKVLNEINSYERFDGGWSVGAVQIFDKGQIIILTNGLMEAPYQHSILPYAASGGGGFLSRSKMGKIRPMAMMAKEQSVSFNNKAVAEAAFAPEADMRVDSSAIGSDMVGSQPKLRKDFPETWLWEEIDENNMKNLTYKVPDTITSWVITGFSLNKADGLGICEMPHVIKTYRPFFISLNIPYSVIRGEIVGIQILIFNYLPSSVTAELTMDNSLGKYKFVDAEDEKIKKMNVQIKDTSVISLTVPITPVSLGYIDLDIKVISQIAGDSVSMPLLVKPPGEKIRKNFAVLIDHRSNSSEAVKSNNVKLTAVFPAERVEGADTVKFNLVGDILGPAIQNLDKLIQLPRGCGEQNMLNFVPDIVILQYLESSGQITNSLRSKIIRYLEEGYQRELTYKHPDGSFSAFGVSDPYGSTWLTAFVVRSFLAAKPYITIDNQVISKALGFLTERQLEGGGFDERGKVLHQEMQGGSSFGGFPMSAYTLLTFIEHQMNEKNGTNYNEIIKRGLNYLTRSLDKLEDPYALNIITYALHLLNDERKDQVFAKLETLAKIEDGGLRFWESELKPLNNTDGTIHHQHNFVKPSSIEMTSYALLTYLNRNMISESVQIVRWLLKQRNSNGGFVSTQDTVVGLTALAKFATLTFSPNLDLKIKISTPSKDFTKDLVLNLDNAIVTQEVELPTGTTEINVEAEGHGIGLAQISWTYNVENKTKEATFKLESTVGKLKHAKFELSSCISYPGNTPSNMAVLEVNLPSGFSFEEEDLSKLLHSTIDLKRFDRDKNSDSKIFLYFDSLNKTKICMKFFGHRTHPVTKLSPAYMLLYDYYDNSKSERVFYEPPSTSMCDLCEKDDEKCLAKYKCKTNLNDPAENNA